MLLNNRILSLAGVEQGFIVENFEKKLNETPVNSEVNAAADELFKKIYFYKSGAINIDLIIKKHVSSFLTESDIKEYANFLFEEAKANSNILVEEELSFILNENKFIDAIVGSASRYRNNAPLKALANRPWSASGKIRDAFARHHATIAKVTQSLIQKIDKATDRNATVQKMKANIQSMIVKNSQSTAGKVTMTLLTMASTIVLMGAALSFMSTVGAAVTGGVAVGAAVSAGVTAGATAAGPFAGLLTAAKIGGLVRVLSMAHRMTKEENFFNPYVWLMNIGVLVGGRVVKKALDGLLADPWASFSKGGSHGGAGASSDMPEVTKEILQDVKEIENTDIEKTVTKVVEVTVIEDDPVPDGEPDPDPEKESGEKSAWGDITNEDVRQWMRWAKKIVPGAKSEHWRNLINRIAMDEDAGTWNERLPTVEVREEARRLLILLASSDDADRKHVVEHIFGGDQAKADAVRDMVHEAALDQKIKTPIIKDILQSHYSNDNFQDPDVQGEELPKTSLGDKLRQGVQNASENREERKAARQAFRSARTSSTPSNEDLFNATQSRGNAERVATTLANR